MIMYINPRSSFPLVFLATTTVIFLLLPATATATGDLCEATDYKPLCRATVKGITDPAKAIKKAIELVVLKTKHALLMARLLEQSDTNDICKESYDDAISDLEESIQSLEDNDEGTLNTNLSAAISYYTTCDDAYAEMDEQTSLTKVNVILEHMVSNCLALVTLLHH
ncbi:hypothetical protein JCGZ_17789 [Jatropha curcas]|uniref:Pectinesterase inhibitor domain-containing protein n=1 Tax=Jatropha curcas TaxID=180498 RepID=A0A067JRQ1_JATCU|nr:uncharacterized protein LOC105644638 [Jatropha curcas]KDP26631.1 hypothetical protein JCGZ_17789 [Jatropha curcas]